MLNVPMLKLEKNNTYLSTQLEQQENNKQLILNIIANINLILSNPSTETSKNYESILDSANDYLSSISDNIITLERLNVEILTISKELEDLQSDENKTTKSKEFFIKAFSKIKTNIAEYTKKFQKAQKKLENDNSKFNEFINVNNFKYNFETIVNEEGVDSETYKFTGFCIDNQVPDIQNEVSESLDNVAPIQENTTSVSNDEEILEVTINTNVVENNTQEVNSITEDIVEVNNENIEANQKIDELTNNFRKMLIDLSNNNSKPENTSDLISSYFQEISQLSPNTINEELKNLGNEVEITKEPQEDLELSEDIADYSIYTEGENIDDVGEEINNYYKIPNVETETDIQEKSQTVDNIIIDNQDEEIIENANNIDETQILDTVDITSSNIEEVQEEPLEEVNNNVEKFINNQENDDYDVSENMKRHEIQLRIDESSPVNGIGYDLGSTFAGNFTNNSNIKFTSEAQSTNIIDESVIQEELLKNKLKKIITAAADNETLIISEKTNKIYLPYKITELVNYIDNYPNVYSSLSDVVEQEFILPFDYFMKHPYKSRFFETYNLIRNRQGRSPISALGCSLKLIHKTNLNPAIIASCKNEEELKNYIYYLDANRLEEFKAFNIIYQVSPL